MDGTNFKDIVEYIRGIAEPMVTAGYDIILKQVKFNMIWYMVLFVILVVSTIFLIKLVKYSFKKEEDDKYGTSAWIAGIMFGIAGAFGSVVGSIVSLHYFLNSLINPDWMAIKMILGVVTGGG
jgi:hypothetical protein